MFCRIGIAALLCLSIASGSPTAARAQGGWGDDDAEDGASADAPDEGAPIVAEDHVFQELQPTELSHWSFLAHIGGGLRLADSGWPEEADYTYYGIATGAALLAATARRRFDPDYVAQGRLLLDYAPYSAQGLSPASFSTGYYHAWSTQLELGVLSMQEEDGPTLLGMPLFFGGGIIVGARHFTGSFQSVPSGGRDYDDSLWVMVLGITAEAGLSLDEERRFELLLRAPLQVSGLSGSGLTEVGFTALFGVRAF